MRSSARDAQQSSEDDLEETFCEPTMIPDVCQ